MIILMIIGFLSGLYVLSIILFLITKAAYEISKSCQKYIITGKIK